MGLDLHDDPVLICLWGKISPKRLLEVPPQTLDTAATEVGTMDVAETITTTTTMRRHHLDVGGTKIGIVKTALHLIVEAEAAVEVRRGAAA